MMMSQNLGNCKVQLGTSSNARVGVGVSPNSSYEWNVGGSAQFNIIRAASYIWASGNDKFINRMKQDVMSEMTTAICHSTSFMKMESNIRH